MTDEEFDALDKKHQECVYRSCPRRIAGPHCANHMHEPWPCDTAIALQDAKRERENAELLVAMLELVCEANAGLVVGLRMIRAKTG